MVKYFDTNMICFSISLITSYIYFLCALQILYQAICKSVKHVTCSLYCSEEATMKQNNVKV